MIEMEREENKTFHLFFDGKRIDYLEHVGLSHGHDRRKVCEL